MKKYYNIMLTHKETLIIKASVRYTNKAMAIKRAKQMEKELPMYIITIEKQLIEEMTGFKKTVETVYHSK